MESYATLITALVSGALGGTLALVGVGFTNKSNTKRLLLQLNHEKSRKNEDIFRSRGEELYELLNNWVMEIVVLQVNHLMVMQNKITYDQCLDLDSTQPQEMVVRYGRINMLIEVYFPSLRALYKDVTIHRDSANNIIDRHKQAYSNGNTSGTKFVEPLIKEQREMSAALELLNSALVENIRAL